MAYMTVNDIGVPAAQRGDSLSGRVLTTLRLWRQRSRDRAELATLSARDARDLGIDPGVISYEASKPFWTA